MRLGELWVCRQADTPQPEPLGAPARTFHALDAALAAGPDVVLVTNPTSLHVETALAAVRAGSHVFVEKPLGSAAAGVADLLAEAARSGRQVMVGYNFRFHPGLARLRELLHAGVVGRPISARAEVGEYLPAWHPWEDYRQGYSARSDLGGGAVLTLSHELDSLCWLLGRPRTVFGMVRHVSRLETDAEDVAEIALEFEGGAIATAHMDYVRRPPRRCVEVVGEEGVLRWELEENRVLVYAPSTSQWRVEQGSPTFERNDMFRAEIAHVAARVSGDPAEPLADGYQGAAILAIALAALRSSAEGRSIDLRRDDEPGDTAEWLNSLASPPLSHLSPPPTSFA